MPEPTGTHSAAVIKLAAWLSEVSQHGSSPKTLDECVDEAASLDADLSQIMRGGNRGRENDLRIARQGGAYLYDDFGVER